MPSKISALDTLSGANLGINDCFLVLDIDDLSMGPGGTNKIITTADLIYPIYRVTNGTIEANKAYIADSDGKLEGVSATQFARLNVSAGAWTAEKVLTADSDGELEGVSATQFARLSVSAGAWTAEKVLTTNADGELAGVSLTQFQVLDTTAGTIEANKAAVWDGNQTIASAALTINAESGLISIVDGDYEVVTAAESVQLTYGSRYNQVTAIGSEIFYGGTTTRYQYNNIEMATASASTTIAPAILQFIDGTDTVTLTATSLSFVAAALEMILTELPTSDPLVRGQVWVDGSGYLRLSAGT